MDNTAQTLLSSLDPTIRRMLEQCQGSTELLAKLFMKETFWRPFNKPHKQIFDAIDSNLPFTVVQAPRGVGKTSITSKAYLIRQILFQHKHYIVYVSKSQTSAVEKTENLKRELQSNSYFMKLFGSIKSDTFAKDEWVTSTGIKVIPRGSGQQIRGLLHDNYRPDLIVVDDLEDSELVLNEEYRRKQWEWFNSDLLNSVDRGSPGWNIVVIGTLLHEDSLLAKLLDDKAGKSWHKVQLSIWDGEHKSLWPDMLSTEQIRELYADFCAKGLADLFAREYCGDPISRESATFRQEYFKPYSEAVEDITKKSTVETVVILDPAKSVNPTSDYSAIVGVGIDTARGILYVRDVVMRRMQPDDMYDEVITMLHRLGARTVGLEVTSLNEFILQPFKNHMLRRGKMFELVELKPRGNMKKEYRIAALLPYYRQGHVFHNDSGVCRLLEDQLLSFPRSKHDDAMDALAYVVEMLEIGGRYFSPDVKGSERDALRQLEEEDRLEPAFEEWEYV